MNYSLIVEKLCKKVKRKLILNNINISFKKGKVYGLVGPNGSGKSTFLKIICGLYLKSSGNIFINGKIGYLIENPDFYKNMTSFENLFYISNFDKRTTEEELKTFLKNFDVDFGKVKFKNFSYGMKMKLGIANAFLNNPDIIILDEPTNGLDPLAIKKLREQILLYKSNKTIIISSHLLSEIEKICDEVIFIKDGKIVDKISNVKTNLEESYLDRMDGKNE